MGSEIPCKMGQKGTISEIVVEWVKMGAVKILVKRVKRRFIQLCGKMG